MFYLLFNYNMYREICTRRPRREPSWQNEELCAHCLCLLLECRHLFSTPCVLKRITAPPNKTVPALVVLYSIGQQTRALGDEGLHMETRDLRCALTQPYASTFRTFTVPVRLWSLSEKVLARFSLCIERCAYNSVNCIMAN